MREGTTVMILRPKKGVIPTSLSGWVQEWARKASVSIEVVPEVSSRAGGLVVYLYDIPDLALRRLWNLLHPKYRVGFVVGRPRRFDSKAALNPNWTPSP